MDETLDTGGSSWAGWIQDVAGSVIGKAADAQYVRPYDIKELQLQALGDAGYYREGMAGTVKPNAGLGGISPTMLLLAGAAVVVVLMLKD